MPSGVPRGGSAKHDAPTTGVGAGDGSRRIAQGERPGRRRPGPEGPESGGLRRAITPGLLLFFIVGDILGGGIYARVGQVAGETGGAIWVAFLVALVAAAFTAGPTPSSSASTRAPAARGSTSIVRSATRF
jgi:hypothetical protein